MIKAITINNHALTTLKGNNNKSINCR